MGAGKRHEEERACPLCIEPLDPTEKSFYPCPCGYQVCLFCFDRLKNDCGNLCPGCRTEYGSDTNPFAKRAPSVALPFSATTSQGSRSSSPAAVPAPAAPPPMAAPAPARSSNPPPTLQQARQMHRAAQQKLAAQQAAAAAAAAQTAAASQQAAAFQQAAAQPPQQQQPVLPPAGRPASESAHQLSRRGSGRTSLQHSGTLEQQLASACAPAQHVSPQQPAAQPPPPARQPPQAAQLQQQQQPQPQADYGRMVWPDALPMGGRAPAGASLAYDTAQPLALQPAQWLPAAAVGVGSLWGNGPVAAPAASPPAAPPPPRRTAIPPRPLPLQGGPAVEASPGAEAELAGARRAVRNGRLSASDAAWNLLSTRASVRAV